MTAAGEPERRFRPDPKAPVGAGIGQKKARPRRKANAKQWETLREKKLGPCRVCDGLFNIELHHLVPRAQLGGDVGPNLVPLCSVCHRLVTNYDRDACAALRLSLTDDEYAHAVTNLGEGSFEARYPVRYEKP